MSIVDVDCKNCGENFDFNLKTEKFDGTWDWNKDMTCPYCKQDSTVGTCKPKNKFFGVSEFADALMEGNESDYWLEPPDEEY